MLLPIRNIGSTGIIFDTAPYDTAPNTLTDGNNIRVLDGKLIRSSGTQTAASYDAPIGSFPTAFGPPRHIAPWFAATINTTIVAFDDVVIRYISDPPIDISQDVTVRSSVNWTHTQVGEWIILNNGSQPPLVMHPDQTGLNEWNDQPNNPDSSAYWPAELKAKILKPFQGFMIAANMQEVVDEKPYSVKWSDTVDPLTLATTWEITPQTLAGEQTLAGDSGKVQDILQLNRANMIYMEHGVYIMEYIGGNNVFSFRTLFDDDGLINQGAVCEVNKRHIFVGNHDIYMTDGNTKSSISDRRVTRKFFENLSHRGSVYAFHYEFKREVWICFASVDGPDHGVGVPGADRALIYNYEDDCWTIIDLPLTCEQLVNTPRLDDVLIAWNDLPCQPETEPATMVCDDQGGPAIWENQTAKWSTLNDIGFEVHPMLRSQLQKSVIYQDIGYTHDGADYVSYGEMFKIDFDEFFKNATKIKYLNAITPQVGGSGDMTFQFGTSFNSTTGVLYDNIRTYNIDIDYKIDMRDSGRYLGIKFSMTSGNFELTGWDVDVKEAYGR